MRSRPSLLHGFAVLALWIVVTAMALAAPASTSIRTPATGPTRAHELDLLVNTYNARFNVPTPRRDSLRRQFMLLQEATFARWNAQGALHPILEVRNDIKPSLVYTISALEDESARFMGLVYEQSEYEDILDESSLRLFHRAHLESGVSIAGLRDLDAIRFQIPNSTPFEIRVLPLRLAYALDLKKQNFGAVDLSLEATGLPAPHAWRLRDPSTQRPLTQVHIEFWYSILSLNGGVKRLTLNSR
jgi:hypothetical protein